MKKDKDLQPKEDGTTDGQPLEGTELSTQSPEEGTSPEILTEKDNPAIVSPSDEKKIILVLGMRGTGKSTKVKELLNSRPRILVYDTLCEYVEGLICEDIKSLCTAWGKVYKNKEFKLIYQPANPSADFGDVCELVFSCGDVCFVVEEIDSFLTLSPSGLDTRFLNIVQRGRHHSIELIGITQRPYAIPTILRSQCKELYTFRQFEERDINWLGGILGDACESVRNLKQFNFIGYVNGDIITGRTKKVR